MTSPKLSICIPTFNRSGYLSECLSYITRQFDDADITSLVEIVVSDNDSSDNTGEVVKLYADKFLNIAYLRNEKNLGYDRNVEKAIFAAKGDFIWTLSDDELVQPNSIKFLLDILFEHPDAVWACIDNGSLINENYRIYEDGNSWLAAVGLAGGQLSQNVYNRKFLPSSIEKYFDNLWIHYSLAREMSASSKQLLIKNIFKEVSDDRVCRWASGGTVLTTYTKLKNIIDGLSSYGYDRTVVEKVLADMERNLPRQVASAKINGLRVNGKNCRLILDSFKHSPLVLIKALKFFVTPSRFLLFIKRLCLKK